MKQSSERPFGFEFRTDSIGPDLPKSSDPIVRRYKPREIHLPIQSRETKRILDFAYIFRIFGFADIPVQIFNRVVNPWVD
jgi:hypothetical protein